MTNGRIDADVGISTTGSRLDLAGVALHARTALVHAEHSGSTVTFSHSRVEGPRRRGVVHGLYKVTPESAF
jgi:hypothetical protein